MPQGEGVLVGRLYSVMVPLGVIVPILPVGKAASANQRLPSGPTQMPRGTLPAARAYSVKVPAGVSLPILPAPASVNHRLPSGPEVMPHGPLLFVGTVNSTMPVLKRTRLSRGSTSSWVLRR